MSWLLSQLFFLTVVSSEYSYSISKCVFEIRRRVRVSMRTPYSRLDHVIPPAHRTPTQQRRWAIDGMYHRRTASERSPTISHRYRHGEGDNEREQKLDDPAVNERDDVQGSLLRIVSFCYTVFNRRLPCSGKQPATAKLYSLAVFLSFAQPSISA